MPPPCRLRAVAHKNVVSLNEIEGVIPAQLGASIGPHASKECLYLVCCV